MNVSELKSAAMQADVVSFDVFDTLITRLVLHPADVFSFVEILAKNGKIVDSGFRKSRIEAESTLCNGEKKYSYTLDDIYGVLQSKLQLSDEETDKLKKLELFAEEKLAYPRKDIYDFFMELYQAGKKIVLVSDMYLSSQQILHLLEVCGYPTDVPVIVSNEHDKIKGNGSLWQEFFETYAGTTLHIGDNVHSDYNLVKKAGHEAFLVPNPYERFTQSDLYNNLYEYDNGAFGNSLLLGRLCNKILFNNAFSDGYDGDALVGLWTGAVLSCFIRWLVNTKDDSLLLFVTREGYILRPMYNEYCKVLGVEPQKNCLFFSSRQATSIAALLSREDIDDILGRVFEGTFAQLLATRCNYRLDANDKNGAVKIVLPLDKRKARQMTEPYADAIIAKSKAARDVYKQYMDDCLAGTGCTEMTVVDIGYQGRAQYNLTKIYSQKISGKYLMKDQRNCFPDRLGCRTDSVCDIDDDVHPVYSNLNLIESVMMVPYGQVTVIIRGKDGKPTPVYNDAAQTAEAIQKAQEGFLEFVKEDAGWQQLCGSNFDYPLALAENIWMCLIYFNNLPDSLIECIQLDDAFDGYSTMKYNSKEKCWITEGHRIPFVFFENHSKGRKKQRIKLFVRRHIPSFLFEPARLIWVKYIK